jgi:antitoxin CcdA
MPDTHLPTSDQRRPTNVTLPESLVAQARELKINISQACEAGLAAQVKAAREKQWLEENREAIEYWNEKMAREGLPLAEYRVFNAI